MRATRRNVLVILGVLTIAGGALFGTGAFTTAEAERSVSIQTADDSDAVIGLEAGNSSWVTNDGGQLSVNATQLNRNANFTVSPAFTVTNNYDQPVTVTLSNDAGTNEPEIVANETSFDLGVDESQDIELTFVTDGVDADSYDVTLTVSAET